MVGIHKANFQTKTVGVEPSFALVFYKSVGGQSVLNVTRHAISNENKLSLGRIVSPQALVKELSGAIGRDATDTILPSNVLINAPDRIIWHTPRFVGDMWFRLGSKPTRLRVEWPPLLYIVKTTERRMNVFALGSNSRPTGKSKLYHAPLMNLDEHGSLCLGTAHLPRSITIDDLEACQASLVESQFTHTNHTMTLKGGATNTTHFAFWKSKAAKGKQGPGRVKASEMQPLGKTLGGILEAVQ